MAFYGDSETILITAKGSAETEFTSATFTASITTRAKTGPDAKKKALPLIETLKSTILQHADKGGIDTSRMATTFGVDTDTNRNTGEFNGYKCLYTISFKGTNVAAAPEVHDAMTSIENVESSTPIYNANDSAEVHAKAFAQAVEKAKGRFNDQCKALGLPSDAFFIKTWSIQEAQGRGKFLSFTEGPTLKSVGITPGKATIDMTVNFGFTRVIPLPEHA